DLLSLVPGKLTAKDPHKYHILATSRPHQYLMSLVPGELVPKVCPICQTLITKYNSPEDMMNQAVFWVVRDLGSCEWPADRSWFDQCRLTGARFSLNEIYWYRSQNLRKMMQGVHGQWQRTYCLEQKGGLLQCQREGSQTADEGIQIANTFPAMAD
ncbi:uncharacterized protein N7518_005865, partial [Penicillium psychrosexuale]|uniref:uncharacterized protein n=1 Tax=Penicillium psychrosexuale TaxID=1002107 RepID=UPI002545809A